MYDKHLLKRYATKIRWLTIIETKTDTFRVDAIKDEVLRDGDSDNTTTIAIKLLCPRGTQTCALAVANIAHAVYLSGCHSRSSHQV